MPPRLELHALPGEEREPGADGSAALRRYRLNVWDVGGQKTLRAFWRNYYEQTDGLIWVVDSSDVHRLRDCREELHKLLKEERLAGSSLLILANKQDIAGALGAEQIEAELGLGDMGRRHWRVGGCSGVTGAGLVDSFDWIVTDIGQRIYMTD